MSELVFDIGMHNGDDTAYYLSRGYRVLAVEANPSLCASARERFAHARTLCSGNRRGQTVGSERRYC